MTLPKEAVLVIGDCLPDGARRVTMCINHLAYGVYKAYAQKGGSCYKLYPMRGHRHISPAPVVPFVVAAQDIAANYSYY
jgi:hypothetical protein